MITPVKLIKPIVVLIPLFILCLSLFFTPFLYARGQVEAQNEPVTSLKNIEKQIDNDFYYITTVKYIITGLVTEGALETKLNLKNGKKIFESRTNFFNYIKLKNLDLKNLRQLKKSSVITVSYEWNKNENRYDVILKVFVVTDNTRLVLPYFNYSTNSGFLLSARGRDYNFLGSLEPLAINLDYTIDESDRNSFGIGFSFTYPFLYKKNIISLGIEEEFKYRDDNKITHNNALLLGYLYPLTDFITLSSYIKQRFNTETNTDEIGYPIYSSGKNEFNFGSSFLLNTTPLAVVDIFSYNPAFVFDVQYSLTANDPMPEDRERMNIGFKHSLNFGRIDWIGNFRKGMSVSIGNKNIYSFDKTGWNNSLTFESKFHTTKWNRVGLNMRLYGIYTIYNNQTFTNKADKGSLLGDRLRGIVDNTFDHIQSGVVLNTGVVIRLFEINPIASFHLGTTFDVAVGNPANRKFNADTDIKYSIALEGLAFALFSRSIIIRLSYGIDLGRVIKEKELTLSNREISFGLSLLY